MKRECQLNGLNSKIGVRSEEDGQVSVTIGTTGRVVVGDILTKAIQKARSAGLKPDLELSTVCTVSEVEGRPDELVVSDSKESAKRVTIKMGDVEDEVSFSELLEAVSMCSRKI